MRITIDCTCLLTEKEAGISKYTKNLISALSEIDKINNYTLFFYTSTKERRRIFLEKEKNFVKDNFSSKTLRIPQYGLEILWNKLGLKFPTIEFFTGPADIFHSPGYRVPLTKRAKLITTIHDLTRLKLKEMFPAWIVEHFLSIVKPTVERSDKIITISENTKKDLIDIFNITDEKIKVIYLGVSSDFYKVDDIQKIRETLDKYNISQPYLLCVSTSLGKNKNLETLIRSFKVLKEKYKLDHKLVIAGRKSQEYEILYKLVCELKIDNSVIFTDYVPEDELIYIYNGADVFVFLSLYEGFGLPPLEAMACGVAVVVANTSSLPEVVGDAGILVEPYNIEQIVESIYKIISDYEFKKRLVEKGIERVKIFSWKKCAEETINLYNDVYLA